MRDEECVALLQWCLPRLEMRWSGFRRVRGQVCKRIDRRMREIGLSRPSEYRHLLERDPAEWGRLDAFCRVTISRFYRDHGVFSRLARDVLPALSGGTVRCWSAGCASGEEPYTLAICARHLTPRPVRLRILATDADPHMLERARSGCYSRGSLKELPPELIGAAFELRSGLPVDDQGAGDVQRSGSEPGPSDEIYRIRKTYRQPVSWLLHDVRTPPPDGPFDVVLCRNLVFTYFDERLQQVCLDGFRSVMRRGAALVIGKHEALPANRDFEPWFPEEGIYKRPV